MSARRVVSAVAVCLAATAGRAAAQGAPPPAGPQAPDTTAITPAMVDAGRTIFHTKGTCFACHGAQLQGTQIAPTLIKTVWKDAKGGDTKAIYYVVTHGVPGTLMVKFPGGITSADAVNVVSYIWSVNHRGVKP